MHKNKLIERQYLDDEGNECTCEACSTCRKLNAVTRKYYGNQISKLQRYAHMEAIKRKYFNTTTH